VLIWGGRDARQHTARFRVVDSETGMWLPDVTVTVNGSISDTTDVFGQVSFDLEGNRFEYSVEADDYISNTGVMNPSTSVRTVHLRHREPNKIYIMSATVILENGSRRDALDGSVSFDKMAAPAVISVDVDWNEQTPGDIFLRGRNGGREAEVIDGVPVPFGQLFDEDEIIDVIARTQNWAVTDRRQTNITILSLPPDLMFNMPNLVGDPLPLSIPVIGGDAFTFGDGSNLLEKASKVSSDGLKVIYEFGPGTTVNISLFNNNYLAVELSGKIEIPITDYENRDWSGHLVFGRPKESGPLFEIVKIERTYPVIKIPCLITFTLEADVKGEVGIVGNPYQGTAGFSGSITPQVIARLQGGPGAEFQGQKATIGGYMAFDVDFKLNLLPLPVSFEPTASFSFGLYAEFALAGWNNQKSVQLGSWSFPNRNNAAFEDFEDFLNSLDLEPSWQLIGRDYLLTAPSGFVGDKIPVAALSFGPSNVTHTPVFENTIGTIQSELQIIDGTPVLVYTIDDTTRAPQDGLKLVYSTFNGTTWTAPQAINNTGTRDSAFYFNGSSVVWEKSRTNLPATIDDISDIMKETEIYYSSFNGTAWSTPFRLTNNTVADFAPVVAESGNRRLAAWLTNNQSDVFGETGRTDIQYRIFNGTAWGAVQTIQNVGPVGRISAGFDGTTGTILYQKDGILHRVTTANATPVAMGDVHRHALNYYDGKYTLANFDEDGNLTVARDLLGTPSDTTIETRASSFSVPTIAQNGDDLYICWVERVGNTDALLGVSYIDGVWSERMVLISNEFDVRRPHIILTDEGELMAAYLRGEPAEVLDNGDINFGQRDLFVTTITPGYDLAIIENSLRYDDRIYSTDGVAAMSMAVANAGQKQIDGYEIQVFEGSQLRATIDKSGEVLKAGEMAEVEFVYSPQRAGILQTLTVKVVPIGVDDVNELNNSAEITIGQINAVVTEAYFEKTPDAYWLNATVQNIGSVTADKFTVNVRKDSADGDVIFTKTYDNVIANEYISFSEPIEDIEFDESGIAVYFVTVEAANDVNPLSGTMMAVAEYIPDGDGVLWGDVNGDGVINAADITMLRSYIAARSGNEDAPAAWHEANPNFNRANADATGDGFINSADVTLLRRWVAATDKTTVKFGPPPSP
jgi:hypothetical protein